MKYLQTKLTMIIIIILVGFFYAPEAFALENTIEDNIAIGKAKSLNETEQYNLAEEVLESLYQNHPKSFEIRYEYARALGLGDQPKRAVSILNDLSAEYSENTSVKDLHLGVLKKHQMFKEARQLIIDDQSRNQTYETFIELADLSHWLSEYEVEAEYLKKALVMQSGQDDIQVRLAMAYFQLGEFEDAVLAFEQIGEKYEYGIENHMALAQSQYQSNRVDEADQTFREILRRHPGHVKATTNYIYFLADHDRADEAMRLMNSLDVRSVWLEVLKADLLAGQLRYKEAITLVLKALKDEIDDRDLLLRLARFYSWDRQYDASVVSYENLIRANSNWILPQRELARVLGWMREYEKSLEQYQLIIDQYPDDIVIQHEMNAKESYYNLNDMNAIEHFVDWIVIEPDAQEAMLDLSIVYARNGQFGEANDSLKQLISLNPRHHRAIQMLGKIKVIQNRPLLQYEYLYEEADSGSRQVDYRINHMILSEDIPINENWKVLLEETQSFHTYSNLSLMHRFGQMAAIEWRQLPRVSLEAGYQFNHYSDDIEDTHLHYEDLLLRIHDSVQLHARYDKQDVKLNLMTKTSNLQEEKTTAEVFLIPQRDLKLELKYQYSDFSDGNEKHDYSGSIQYAVIPLPTRLSVEYEYQEYQYGFSSPIYFSPNSYHTNKITLEWLHYLNEDELFWGDNDTYYRFQYGVNLDVKDEISHRVTFLFHKDWTDRISTEVNWWMQQYESDSVYSESGMSLVVNARF
ncbi:MAG: putative Zn-dependent protease [Candidatus Omnitrophota bacterium]|jgi:predicted Zn-dependent protease